MAAQSSGSAQAPLVGIPEIARIAQVGPSAVGNWRKRHEDFPKPKVQTPSGSLFDLDEVERWLVENSKIAERVPAYARLWALADSARTVWRADQFASFCVAALVYFEVCERAQAEVMDSQGAPVVPEEAAWSRVREEDKPQEFVRRLRHAAELIEELNQDVAGLLVPGFAHVRPSEGGIARSVALTLDEATDDLSPRFEWLEEMAPQFEAAREPRRGRLSRNALTKLTKADRFAAEHATPEEISYILCQVVNTADGVIFDPAAGEGGLLLFAAMWRNPENRPATLVGVEIDEAVRRISRSRCYLYEFQADIRLGNALTTDLSELPKADSVVLDPPYELSDWGRADVYLHPRWRFGPPSPKNADFAWLQIAVLQLKPDGRAGVVLPSGSLSGGGRDGQIRRSMIEAGVVEAIVLLPPRLRADTSIPLAIWLLRSPYADDRTEEILLVDASGLGVPGRSQFTIEEESIDRLGRLVQQWRSRHEIGPDDSEIAVAVPITSIIDANLEPKRYRTTPGIDLAALEQRAEALRVKVGEGAVLLSEALTRLAEQLDGTP